MTGELGVLGVGPSSKPTRTFNHALSDMRSLTAAALVLSLSAVSGANLPFFADWQMSLVTTPCGACDVRWVPASRVIDASSDRGPCQPGSRVDQQ